MDERKLHWPDKLALFGVAGCLIWATYYLFAGRLGWATFHGFFLGVNLVTLKLNPILDAILDAIERRERVRR